MVGRIAKTALVVSHNGAEIVETLERCQFEVVAVVVHEDWSNHIGEMEYCNLVVLDEVDQFTGGNLQLDDIEERILFADSGPIVLVLTRDEDHRLDRRATSHRRWKVHHKSQVLEPCLQELYLAGPSRGSAVIVG